MIEDNDGISKLAWDLFVATGGVNYYLLHKKTKRDDEEKERR